MCHLLERARIRIRADLADIGSAMIVPSSGVRVWLAAGAA
jgi:hypothetical protein